MTDRIFIDRLEVACVIGVHGWERHAPRTLLVDIELEADTRRAAGSDEVVDAVDYEAVAECVRSCADTGRYRLLESLAGAITDRLLEEQPAVTAISIRITKPGAVARATGAGIIIRRERNVPT